MAKISVIMPSLNVSKFIDECLHSVVNQTMHDLEIIVVDAGSTDGTVEIINSYVKRDPRVRLLHSDIRSYGYQMNMGISAASGQYISIVETDDIIRTDMMQVLYDEIIVENADFVKGTARGFYPLEDGEGWDFTIYPCEQLRKENKVIVNPSEHPVLFDSDNFLWNGLYRSEFLKGIKFHETSGAAFQDISALFRIISRAQKAVYINHIVYDYRQNNVNASSYNRNCFRYAAAEYEYIKEFLDGLSKEWIKQYYLKIVGLSYDRMLVMANTGEYWNEAIDGIDRLQALIKEGLEKNEIALEDYEPGQAQFLLRFVENPKTLFQEYADEYKASRDELDKIANALAGKNYYIFGAGMYGEFLFNYLRCYNIGNMICFIDNNTDKQGKLFMNKEVVALKDIELDRDAMFVIAAKRRVEELREQLSDYGVRLDNMLGYNKLTSRLLLIKKNR